MSIISGGLSSQYLRLENLVIFCRQEVRRRMSFGQPALAMKMFLNSYKERIEVLIKSKMEGEVAQVEEKRPKKPVAKSMMEALRSTAESLE